MRLVDGMMAIPALLLAMLILTTLGSSPVYVVLGIAVVFMPRTARMVRGVALSLGAAEFVDAARLRGESGAYVIFREMLPNAWAPIIVETSIRFSYAILLATSLGFLGLGAGPPTPDWGLMINEALPFLDQAPWLAVLPAARDRQRGGRGQPDRRGHPRGAGAAPESGRRHERRRRRPPRATTSSPSAISGLPTGRAPGGCRRSRACPSPSPRGACCRVVGESGSGKSTLALAVLGALGGEAAVTGEVRYRGDDLLRMTPAARRRLWGRRLAMVFQDPGGTLNPVLHRRRAGDGGPAGARAPGSRRGPAPHGGAVRGCPLAEPRRAREALPAPALRRPATARLHRHRAGLQSRRPDPRRADDGARRDHRGADPRPGRRPAPPLGRGHPLHHAQPRRGRPPGRRGRGDVRGRGRRARSGRASLFARPRHPYTLALMECLPHVDRRAASRLLPAIPGFLPGSDQRAGLLPVRAALRRWRPIAAARRART